MKNFKVKKLADNDLEYQMKVWDKTIDVQMHFNELQMKIRNFAILVISALIGAAGIALKDRVVIDQTILWMHFQGNLSAIFFGAAAVTWLAFFFMDHNWYYPLLIGAVKHGMAIEESLKDRVPLIGLTTRIGDESPQKLLFFTLRSKDKSFFFYLVIFFTLLVLAVGSAWLPTTDQHGNSAAIPQETKLRPPEHRSPTTATSPPSPQNQASGTTVILNQEFNNGAPPIQNTQVKKVKTKVDGRKSAVENCVTPESTCQAMPLINQK